MCGIVGAVAGRDIVGVLLEGLSRLEYRGYDSSGLAILDHQGHLVRLRAPGNVQNLKKIVQAEPRTGYIGIAHTRWATHGVPSEVNAHPHVSENILIVHNGIIENHLELRVQLEAEGYHFTSDTDTEAVAHLIHKVRQESKEDLLTTVRKVTQQLRGAYGMVIMDSRDASSLIAARSGSPLVIGLGDKETFVASDPLALLPVTNHFVHLEEGDIAHIMADELMILDQTGRSAKRSVVRMDIRDHWQDKGQYQHYMQKEIYEQPKAIEQAIMHRLDQDEINFSELGQEAMRLLAKTEHIQIVACGTSFNSGMVARYWLETLARIPCDVDIASEFRYRKPAVRKNSLFITLSQSGETADALAAFRLSKKLGYLGSLTICNVEGSSLARESDFALMMRAGVEVGVASTKAFTAQLTVLLMLTAILSRLNCSEKGRDIEHNIIKALRNLPEVIEQTLLLDKPIRQLAPQFLFKQHAFFLGRGEYYPVAMEGALKLKEISYIHAEAQAAGELKHGPLAMIDAEMPVIVIAPHNELLEKLKANIEEVRARGGQLILFAAPHLFTEQKSDSVGGESMQIITMPAADPLIAPIVYTIPLQLLAYHVAITKGTNVDQPRNLAKSVTVE